MRFISLFSGIGGFELGFEQAGLTCVAQVEIDPACRTVLDRHWPDVPTFTDVCKVGAHNLPACDVITFGSPCQDLSVAGKRAGMQGERSGLFYEAVRVIRELRPAFAIWENVPGALSSAQGRDFGAAIDALADAGAVDIAWRVLDAQWFGVPQRRRRIFVVADFRGHRAASILFEREGVRGYPPARGAQGQDVAKAIRASSGVRGTDDADRMTFVPTVSSKWAKGTGGPAGDEVQNLVPAVAPCLTQNYGKQPDNSDTSAGPMLVPVSIRNGGRDSDRRENRTGIGLSADVMHTLQGEQQHAVLSVALRGRDGGATAEPQVYGFSAGQSASAGTMAWQPEQSPTLRGASSGTNQVPSVLLNEGGGDKAHVLAFTQNQREEVRLMDVSGALNGAPDVKRGSGTVLSSMSVRRLMPVECERLQGFPDDWTDGQSDSTRYRQLGNAVAVPVAAWIGRRLMNCVLAHQDAINSGTLS